MANATEQRIAENFAGLRPVIHPPRDLAPAGQWLQLLLAQIDRVNPFRFPPTELAQDYLERTGQVAGLVAMEAAMLDELNARRRAAWRARYGGTEATGPLKGVCQHREPLRAVESAAA